MSENLGRNDGIRVLAEFVCDAIPASSPEFQAIAPPERPSRRLFTVEDRFTVEVRGTILTPGFTPRPDERIQIGDRVRLRRPDGSELLAVIGGLDFFHPGPNGEWAILIGLPESEVPIGTEVWSA